MQTLTRQNLIDILYGCTILGTGGGGSLAEGIDLIDRALAEHGVACGLLGSCPAAGLFQV